MSSRALRKAQKQREEQERFQQQKEVDEDEEFPEQPIKKSLFTLLDEEQEEDESDDDRGGVAVEGHDSADLRSSSISTAKASNKKKRNKNKNRNKTTTTKRTQNSNIDGVSALDVTNDEGLDEIDKALKELWTGGKSDQTRAIDPVVKENEKDVDQLLAIDTDHLHVQNEMRRLFGRAALDQIDDGQPPPNAGGNRRQQRRVQQIGLAQVLRAQAGRGGRQAGLAVVAMRRNIFVQGKEDWPIATGSGLGMEIENRGADGTVLYRFVHSSAYQNVQNQFDACVDSMDPNRLIILLQHNPYHISTLLQVSEIAKQERDHTAAGELLERALFSFGRAVHSTFAKNLSEGRARLDFARPENREFWLAGWRYMQNLSMRATWRTVYEWAKLLLSISPKEDPYALWLVLDQYALRSQQDLDYLNISRSPAFKPVHLDMPNVKLSQGLAEYRAGNRSKGKQALFTAVGRYPWVVARMMQELNIDPPPAIWGKEPRSEKEKLHSELYATRAKDLWNTPEMIALLTEIASAVPSDTPSAGVDRLETTQNEARHVLLSDEPALIALIPRRFTERMTSVSDPLPPVNNLSSYTSSSHGHDGLAESNSLGTVAENFRELQSLYSFFNNLFPRRRHVERDGNDLPAGMDGEVGDEHVLPSPEEFERRIREAGIDEEVIVERSQRMIQLMGRVDNVAAAMATLHRALQQPGDDAERPGDD